MSEEKKEECCSTSGNSGCCCPGIKKLIVGLVLALLVFTCGYIFGKGQCPFSGQKMCPLVQQH